MQDCIIVDIDGTIALKGDRSPYDWSRVGEDEPNTPILKLVSLFSIGHKVLTSEVIRVVFVSGRDSVCRKQTEMWLDHHFGSYDHLFMRTEGDTRKDSIVKEELYRAHIEGKLNVLFVLDDRQQTVDKWRELGLTCLQVAPGNF